MPILMIEIILYLPIQMVQLVLTHFSAGATRGNVISLTFATRPNEEFVMNYVYGVLGKNMGGYHALTHLVKDNLVAQPAPRTIMDGISSTGLPSFLPPAEVVVGEPVMIAVSQ